MTGSVPGTVNAILARCLVDPEYLEALAQDPAGRVAHLGLDDATRAELAGLDWSRVRAFGGFITKVQHNDLWPVLPYTRALLKAHRREIAVFTAYRPTYLRLRAAGARQEAKIHSFLSFLAESPEVAACPGLLDVAHHEYTRWLAEGTRARSRETADPGYGLAMTGEAARSTARLVPFVRGWLLTVSFAVDPEATIAAINRGTPLDGGAPAARWLGYWIRPTEDRIRLLELDATTVRVLDAVDGSRDVASVARRSGARIRIVRDVLSAAQAQGVVGLRDPSREESHAPRPRR
jgi:hypothetical protein